MLEDVHVILHRPQSSDNVGACARAMKNFGLRHLVLVAPRSFDAERAHKLAVQSEEIVDTARIAATLEDAIAPYSLVIPTTERALEGRPSPLPPRATATKLLERSSSGPVALLFGEESIGLDNRLIQQFLHYSSIPSHPDRRSLNLAQAVLIYGWELHQASGELQDVTRPDAPRMADVPAPRRLLTQVREVAQRVLGAAGFLLPQQPDRALDELLRLLQRADPTQREGELVLAALAQVARSQLPRS